MNILSNENLYIKNQTLTYGIWDIPLKCIQRVSYSGESNIVVLRVNSSQNRANDIKVQIMCETAEKVDRLRVLLEGSEILEKTEGKLFFYGQKIPHFNVYPDKMELHFSPSNYSWAEKKPENEWTTNPDDLRRVIFPEEHIKKICHSFGIYSSILGEEVKKWSERVKDILNQQISASKPLSEAENQTLNEAFEVLYQKLSEVDPTTQKLLSDTVNLRIKEYQLLTSFGISWKIGA